MSQLSQSEVENSDTININEIIKPYLKNWLWFLLVPIISAIIIYFYLNTVTPQYNVQTTVLIKDVKNMPSVGGEFGMLQDLSGIGGMGTNSVDNEIEIFKSKKLIHDVVKMLNIQTSIYSKDNLTEKELYKNSSPFFIKVINEKVNVDLPEKPITISVKGEKIILSSEEFSKDITTLYNKTVSLPYANIIFQKNKNYEKFNINESED